ncbi:MAG: hypothetical protein QXP93_05315 [Nitrososphaerota archaeon]
MYPSAVTVIGTGPRSVATTLPDTVILSPTFGVGFETERDCILRTLLSGGLGASSTTTVVDADSAADLAVMVLVPGRLNVIVVE